MWEKLLVFLFFLLIGSGFAFAQAPYTGGAGDGYGKQHYIYIKGDPGPFVPSQIYPSVVDQGGHFTVLVDGLQNKVEILVHTVEGKFLHRNVAWNVTGSFSQRIGTEGWAAGLYLIEVRADGKALHHKLIVLNP